VTADPAQVWADARAPLRGVGPGETVYTLPGRENTSYGAALGTPCPELATMTSCQRPPSSRTAAPPTS
jgi:hypothetical protein